MTTTKPDNQLTQCGVCGRYGWHITERCPERENGEMVALLTILRPVRERKRLAERQPAPVLTLVPDGRSETL
jgi:hypothetical protein